MANKRGPKAPPTPEHLAALAQGRTEGKAVREYMHAIGNQQKRSRGRAPKDAAAIQAQIDATEDPVERLKLRPLLRAAQERESTTSEQDMETLEEAFVKVAGSYSQRHGLTYSDWRTEGVPASVLKRAGIGRGQ
jgi:DNA polymerase/3'-5' exonuclease PolX